MLAVLCPHAKFSFFFIFVWYKSPHTFGGQPLSPFFSQILFVWLITSVSYCHLDLVLAFLVDFVCRLLFIFYLGLFVCHLGLFHSFSDSFACSLWLHDQGHYFVVIIYAIITSYHFTTCHLR
jgi:hypothetical protein